MPSAAHLVFEDGMVRSLRFPKRCGDAQSILRAGRWPSGESITGSDAVTIARFLKPDIPKKRAKATRFAGRGSAPVLLWREHGDWEYPHATTVDELDLIEAEFDA